MGGETAIVPGRPQFDNQKRWDLCQQGLESRLLKMTVAG
jgi:hypothetical protein